MTYQLIPREPPNIVATLRSTVVQVAREELGKGEIGANNAGRHVWKYTRGRTRGAWCAAFVAWVYESASDRVDCVCPIVRSHSARTLYRRCGDAGTFSPRPIRGGVFCFTRGIYPQAHIGIVTDFDLTARIFYTIEANVGSFKRTRGAVTARCHPFSHPRLLGFAGPV